MLFVSVGTPLFADSPPRASSSASVQDASELGLATSRQQERPESACADEVAARVQHYYESVRDFAADFEQTTRSAVFGGALPGLAEPARGQVVLAKPGKMRWTYTHPEASLVVSDGVTLWLYSPVHKEAQRLPVTQGYLTGAALQFLLGEGQLLDTFRVSASGCGGDGRVELSLSPRESASYERLGLTVLEATGEVVATGIVDLFGNETRISFQQIRRNQDPAAETFQFEPEDDVDVIELGGS